MQLRQVQGATTPFAGIANHVPHTVAALGELLGPSVRRIADVISVPCAKAAQSVLATAAVASQAHANVHLERLIYPLLLYLLTVAGSGDCKSAVDHVVLASRTRLGETAVDHPALT
ncbi:hypothetical protein D3C80_1466230 [compost metagenome]